MTDLRRLGRRGSYRLGRLRVQGLPGAPPPQSFRPSFTRHQHRGPAPLWLLLACAGAAAIWGGAVAGLWFAPFAVGVLAGLANWYAGFLVRTMLIWVTLMALVGWAIPLLAWPALRHSFHASWITARVITSYLGLPPHATIGVALTLLIAAVQAVVGLWLGRALTPRPPSRY